MHGVLLDTATMQPEQLDFSALRAALDSWDFHAGTRPEDTAAHMQATPHLKLICTCATGVNNVNTDPARRVGIEVHNVANYTGVPVARLGEAVSMTVIVAQLPGRPVAPGTERG